jgi:hypothetical protein
MANSKVCAAHYFFCLFRAQPLFFTGFMSSASNHFEYKIRQMDYQFDQKHFHHEENVLDGSGHDGWEVVSAVPIVEEGKTVRILYCMKQQSKRSLI